MSTSHDCVVTVTIELGHQANFLKEPSPEGFTHDWTVFVRGYEGSRLEYFVEKVVFKLHKTFKFPTRVISEPPFRVTESGYAGFILPIEIHFKNKQTPRKIVFSYDLFLNAKDSPPINNVRYEKLKFQNPTPEFKAKLIKAGGIEQGAEQGSTSYDLLSSLVKPDKKVLPKIPREKEKESEKKKKKKSSPRPRSLSPVESLPSLSSTSSDDDDDDDHYSAPSFPQLPPPPPPPPLKKEKESSTPKKDVAASSQGKHELFSQGKHESFSSDKKNSRPKSVSSSSFHKEKTISDKDSSLKLHKKKIRDKDKERNAVIKEKESGRKEEKESGRKEKESSRKEKEIGRKEDKDSGKKEEKESGKKEEKESGKKEEKESGKKEEKESGKKEEKEIGKKEEKEISKKEEKESGRREEKEGSRREEKDSSRKEKELHSHYQKASKDRGESHKEKEALQSSSKGLSSGQHDGKHSSSHSSHKIKISKSKDKIMPKDREPGSSSREKELSVSSKERELSAPSKEREPNLKDKDALSFKERESSVSSKERESSASSKEKESSGSYKEREPSSKEKDGIFSKERESITLAKDKEAVNIPLKEREATSLPSKEVTVAKDVETINPSSKEKSSSSHKDKDKISKKEKHFSHRDNSQPSDIEFKKVKREEKVVEEKEKHQSKAHKRHMEASSQDLDKDEEKKKLKRSSSVTSTDDRSSKSKSSSEKEKHSLKEDRDKEASKKHKDKTKSSSSDKHKHEKSRHSEKEKHALASSHSKEKQLLVIQNKHDKANKADSITQSQKLALTANFQPTLRLSPLANQLDGEESPAPSPAQVTSKLKSSTNSSPGSLCSGLSADDVVLKSDHDMEDTEVGQDKHIVSGLTDSDSDSEDEEPSPASPKKELKSILNKHSEPSNDKHHPLKINKQVSREDKQMAREERLTKVEPVPSAESPQKVMSSSKHNRAERNNEVKEKIKPKAEKLETLEEVKLEAGPQAANGLDILAPNGISIGELIAINEQIERAQADSNIELIDKVVRVIGETDDFELSDVSLSFDICSLEKHIVLQIQSVLRGY